MKTAEFYNLEHFSTLSGCGVQVIRADGSRVFCTPAFERCLSTLSYIDGLLGGELEPQTNASMISGALQSYRFGGRFFFYSPIGLFHFASPIIQDERHVLTAIGGPILMIPVEDYIQLDLESKLPVGCDRGELRERLGAIPIFPPDVANTLSEQLLVNARHLSDAEYLRIGEDVRNKRYSEYILAYFSDAPSYESILKFAEEHRHSKAARKHEKIVAAVTAFIEENYSEKITLEMLSDIVFVSPSYLSRLLKAATGHGFRWLVNMSRIAEAVRLLEHTELSLMDIAYRIGFEDHSYFTKVFKRHMGMNPHEYRNQNKS
ncbi:MAG: helix-turn-helix domain-containing protein [Clostridiales Family XIII bacterium]|jgi:AraC-like DNA-binding protein|nr:helix-turn-helix domain-containing protein [Clostridiales Family XIII bacterium]